MYTTARKFWNVSKWIWLTLVITTLVALVANLAVLQTTDLHKIVLVTVLKWFAQFGLIQTLILIAFGLFIVLTLVSLIITMWGEHAIGGKILRKYLHTVEEAHQGLNPKGFAQQSPSLSVNVPLDAIFIHLNAVSDRPLYDLPYEQQKLLEELRSGSHSDMTQEQREENIQRLRLLWYSQQEQDSAEGRQKQNATIEDVLKALKAKRPVAVILGTPGSGKSTSMRWLALQMARASLSRSYELPKGLTCRQIPVLIRISDYAKHLDAENIPFRQFFTEHIDRTYPGLINLSNILLDELKKGRCLLLFDGLDEVASDDLRRHVAEHIYAFISAYDAESATAQHFNRFIVTSRIVGYEPETFNRYAHYTLRDLEDEQIKQFLTNWCPAVERYQAMASQEMKPLTAQQEVQAKKAGDEQRDRLLEALKNNLSIKRLAVNPLMLTILALIQRSGRTLPQRRIELYQVVTRTLLDNWNKEKGIRVFSVEEIPLAEQLLGDLAYRLHSSDPVLTEQDVKKIASHVMDTYYQRQSGQTKETAVQEFIETLRSSSGLFVESGQGLFSFMHRTFQEYYVALYLLRKPPEELKQFVLEKHNITVWHEPLLLALAYKSIQGSQDEPRQASELIEAIANATDEYETVLMRNLLFAANSIVDCGAWLIHTSLQKDIAYRLFELYGDSFGAGRYTQLKQDIEKVASLWLRGQPQGGNQQDTMPPLLTAWRIALINNDKPDPLRQEGAVHLLASIAPDLASCPKSVLHVLVPPLLQLAGVQDWYRQKLFCPPEIRAQLFQTTAHPCSLRVEEYAFLTLRILDVAGPAGWLHDDWRKWSEKRPEILQLLTTHSLEIDYLLTPGAFPAKRDDSNWYEQLNIADEWKTTGQRDPAGLQAQLLEASDTARYPHAYLFKQMLDSELTSSTTPWRTVWETCLQKEMSYGRSATYKACLHLRLLLCRGNNLQRQEIANELMTDLKRGKQQTQAWITISYLFWQVLRNLLLDEGEIDELKVQYERKLRDVLKLRDMDELFEWLDVRYLIKLRRPYRLWRYERYFQTLRDASDVREWRDAPDVLGVFDEIFVLLMLYMLDVLNMLDLRDILDVLDGRSALILQDVLDLQNVLDKDQIIDILNNMLKEQVDASPSTVLYALYIFLRAYDTIPLAITQQVCNSIQVYQRQRQPLSVEERQLIEKILRQINISPATSRSLTQPPAIYSLPDERATQLDALKQQDQLRKGDFEEILAACTDTRELSMEKLMELVPDAPSIPCTVREIAWIQLLRPFNMEAEALSTVTQALDGGDASVCAAAALLLKNCKKIPQDMREDAAKKIINILSDDELSRRPLDSPGEMYGEIGRLDDVLFETLQVLAE
jgi:hypothetical protein